MNDQRITEIEERRKKITPKPWKAKISSLHCGKIEVEEDRTVETLAEVYCGAYDGHGSYNAEFIAHAPDDIDYLLTKIRELIAWKEEAHPFLFDSLDGAAGHTADTLNRLLGHEED